MLCKNPYESRINQPTTQLIISQAQIMISVKMILASYIAARFSPDSVKMLSVLIFTIPSAVKKGEAKLLNDLKVRNHCEAKKKRYTSKVV